jgi:hypothetical protein
LAPQLSALYREAQRESQCHRRRLGISEIRPFDVADYVERLLDGRDRALIASRSGISSI